MTWEGRPIAWSLVQSTSAQAVGGDQTPAYSSNVTSGNLLILAVSSFAGSSPVTSVTDSRGSTWTRAVTHLRAGDSLTVEVWYAYAASSGACTVTVHKSSTYSWFGLHEYSGIPGGTTPAVAGDDGSGTSLSSGTVSVAGAGTLLFGACFVFDSNATSLTAGSGFTERQNSGNTDVNSMTEDKDVSSSTAATFTDVSTPWVAVGMAFAVTTPAPARVTQAAVESAVQAASAARVTQAVVEAAASGGAAARVTQVVLEAAAGTAAPLRVTQAVVEVAVFDQKPAGRGSSGGGGGGGAGDSAGGQAGTVGYDWSRASQTRAISTSEDGA